MMDDLYAECLVQKNSRPAALKILSLAGLFVSAVSIFYIGVYGCIIFGLMGALTYYIGGTMNIEYEYLLAGKQLSVDRIMNKSRRKKAAEYNMEDIQMIAPMTSDSLKEYERQIKKVTDFSSGRSEVRRYAFIHQIKGVNEKIIFEPDDNLLRCLRMVAPRKISAT